MPPPKKLIESRKSEFLSSSCRLFLEYGYSDVSIDMIIAEVGGSKGFVYNNFGSKGDLFIASIELLCRKISEPLSKLDTSKMGCEQGLLMIGKRFLALSLSPESVALHRLVIAERLDFPQIGQVFMDAGPNQTYRTVAKFMERQQQAGALDKDRDSLELAKLYLGMLNANFLLEMLSSPNSVPKTAVQASRLSTTIQVFLHGLGATRPRQSP